MSNFEEPLQQVNKFVSIQPSDRKTYLEDLQNILNYFTENLINNSRVFERLSTGYYFQGSYADNLKISKPNEYDIVLHLKLPYNNLVQIYRESNKPGYVTIQITNVLKKLSHQYVPNTRKTKNYWIGSMINEINMETQRNSGKKYWITRLLLAMYYFLFTKEKINKETCDHLKECIIGNGFLDQVKISSWFESMMDKIMSKIETKIIYDGKIFKRLTIKGKIYKLRYYKSGPAHTLSVYPQHMNGEEISIDLVPSFMFSQSQWVAPTRYSDGFEYIKNWIAVPKPSKNVSLQGRPNPYFISSFCDTERNIINGKNQMKNTLRLIKKIRDKWNLENLKSYHIKTVFLWEDVDKPKEFWNQSPTIILMKMLRALIERLEDHYLPFFWDKSQNMFADLNYNQVKHIKNKLKNIENTLQNFQTPDQIYRIFLTEAEIAQMNNSEILEEAKLKQHNWNTLPKLYIIFMKCIAIACYTINCIYKLYKHFIKRKSNNKIKRYNNNCNNMYYKRLKEEEHRYQRMVLLYNAFIFFLLYNRIFDDDDLVINFLVYLALYFCGLVYDQYNKSVTAKYYNYQNKSISNNNGNYNNNNKRKKYFTSRQEAYQTTLLVVIAFLIIYIFCVPKVDTITDTSEVITNATL